VNNENITDTSIEVLLPQSALAVPAGNTGIARAVDIYIANA
jgi:hypothetical protein